MARRRWRRHQRGKRSTNERDDPDTQSADLSDVDRDLIEHVEHCMSNLSEGIGLPPTSLLTKEDARHAVNVLDATLSKLNAKLRIVRCVRAELRRRRRERDVKE